MTASTTTATPGATNPYAGNILVDACGPILSPVEIGKRLIHLPRLPSSNSIAEPHVLDHLVEDVRRMHIPTQVGIQLAHSIDLMLRQGYVHRNPKEPGTWQRIYSGIGGQAASSPVQLGAMVTGLSGVGKSKAIELALALYPQVVIHQTFPGLIGPVKQLLWLKIDVPSTGKVTDLVENLTRATDAALGTSFFDDLFGGRKLHGATLAHRWLQKVSPNFLGLLVLDELQNLFKIERKTVRAVASRRGNNQRPTLRIVDDDALKLLLTMSNTAKIPTLFCSTPDGLHALGTRMSTAQRMLTGGFYTIPRATNADDEFFSRMLFPQLCRYQYLPCKLPPSDSLRHLLFELSGGVLRICVLFWLHSCRIAHERGAEALSFDDFRQASSTVLAPWRPAVEALTSNDPNLQMAYEDLYRSADLSTWNSSSRAS